MKRLYLILVQLLSAYVGYSQADAGADKFICKGSSVTIGNMPEDPKFCYSWKASPADPSIVNAKTAKVTVNPSQTTTYTLTVIGNDFSSNTSDEVVVTVVENNLFPPSSVTVASGAPPKIPLVNQPNVWGYTDDESTDVEISACLDGKNWHAIVTSINGNYSEEVRLLPGVQEVTGTGGNTTQVNFCDQVSDLQLLTLMANSWFMLSAVTAHEDVHATRLKPSLEDVANKIETLFEGFSVTDNGQTQQDAILQIKALQAYKIALEQAVQLWDAAYVIRITNDHQGGAGPAYIAEKGVVNPMIANICSYAKAQMWGLCASCPP